MHNLVRLEATLSPLSRRLAAPLAALVAMGMFWGAATSASAAVPTTMIVEGALVGNGGGAVADGTYKGTFSIYSAKAGGVAQWTEGPLDIKVTAGRFSYILGAAKPVNAAALAKLQQGWLGLTIATDPELPRQKLHSVPYAVMTASLACSGCITAAHIGKDAISATKVGFSYAGSLTKGGPANKALDLACTGCVTVAEMKFDADVNLGSKSVTANVVNATTVKATTVQASAFIGDGSKLTGIKTPSGTCSKAGEVVKGIKADGTLHCVKAMDPSQLPGDGIDEISNGLINNQFQNTDCGKSNVGIPDNNPVGISDTLTFGDYGLAQKINVSLHITNSDIAAVVVKLFDPNNKEYLLYNKGSKGPVLKASYPNVTKPVSGDLLTWVNKNPKGKWRILVSDGAFKDNGTDGAIVSWCVNIQTLSSKKIQVKGDLIVDGKMSFSGGGKIDGSVNVAGKAVFEKPVVFNDHVEFLNGWCPTQPNGRRSMVVGGVCTPGVGTNKSWPNAVEFCRAKRADLCSDAQSLILRRHGLLPNYTSYGNWTNAYADNDSGVHHEATGNLGDDHGAGEAHGAPCCYNNTPPRATDQLVKVAPSDKGIRVVYIHNTKDASFQFASSMCTSLNADICNKSQYVYIRTAGKITVKPLWPNDGQDTDDSSEYGTGNMHNDVHFRYAYGFACCASTRPTTACPAGATDTKGVCTVKVVNSGTKWVDAARDCGKLGASICTVSQSSVLRKNGVLKHSGNWTAGFNDCDGQCSGSHGIGNAGNNLNPNSNYGYACCL